MKQANLHTLTSTIKIFTDLKIAQRIDFVDCAFCLIHDALGTAQNRHKQIRLSSPAFKCGQETSNIHDI